MHTRSLNGLPTHVINLDRDKGRWTDMMETFRGSAIHLQRFSAKDGKTVPDDAISSWCKTVCTDSMKGCFASHRALWERVVRDDKLSLILEDDVVPTVRDWDRALAHTLRTLPVDFDMVTLFRTDLHDSEKIPILTRLGLWWCGWSGWSGGGGGKSPNDRKVAPPGFIRPVFSWTLSGYLLSPKGAHKLLTIFPKISYHVDMAIFHKIRHLDLYALEPGLLVQRFEKPSNNTGGGIPSLHNISVSGSSGCTLGYLLYQPVARICGVRLSLSTFVMAVIGFGAVSLATRDVRWVLLGPLTVGVLLISLFRTSLILS